METQLVFDNTSRQLGLCFKQIFRGDQGILGKVTPASKTITAEGALPTSHAPGDQTAVGAELPAALRYSARSLACCEG